MRATPLLSDRRAEPPGTIITTAEEFVAAELERMPEEESDGDRA